MKKNKPWFVYIVETQDGRLYTGITKNIVRRIHQHKEGSKKGGAKFFSLSRPKKIVFTEKFATRGFATKREIEIKKMTRKNKLLLIESQANPLHHSP